MYGDAVYCVMQSVVETPAYLAAAKEEGMTDDEMMAAADLVAANPRAGELIAGSGGCRKVRVGGKGRGKSGGYRVVTFFAAKDVPVFFIAVLSKGTRANFSKAERNAMKQATRSLRESLGARALSRGSDA
jgi:hypothetical protein